MIIGYPVMQNLVVLRGRQHEPVLSQQVHGKMKKKKGDSMCAGLETFFALPLCYWQFQTPVCVMIFFSFYLNKINEVMYLPEPCNL